MENEKINSNILNLYKSIGISPLDAIKALKDSRPELKEQKMTYAGRLDPMADGVIIIVRNQELKKFHDHLKYDKEYLAKIVFGFQTDTYDILGMPKVKNDTELKKDKIIKVINSFNREFEFKIPPFSGYNMHGKPLFKWALEGKLDEIEIPVKKAKIHQLEVVDFKKVSKIEFKKEINRRLNWVVGDFRQDKILKRWNRILSKKSVADQFEVLTIRLNVESGFYVRSFAHRIGKILGGGAILYKLTRTKVGKWNIEDSIKI